MGAPNTKNAAVALMDTLLGRRVKIGRIQVAKACVNKHPAARYHKTSLHFVYMKTIVNTTTTVLLLRTMI